MTSLPISMPCRSPKGISSTRCSEKPTTSASVTPRPPRAWISQISPTRASGPVDSSVSPTKRTMRPMRRTQSPPRMLLRERAARGSCADLADLRPAQRRRTSSASCTSRRPSRLPSVDSTMQPPSSTRPSATSVKLPARQAGRDARLGGAQHRQILRVHMDAQLALLAHALQHFADHADDRLARHQRCARQLEEHLGDDIGARVGELRAIRSRMPFGAPAHAASSSAAMALPTFSRASFIASPWPCA